MLISGAAAGMAAVFRAPLTGLIFALEMPYKDDLAHEALLPSLIASVVSYAVLVAFMGTTPLFAFGGNAPFSDTDLLWSALLGVICGFVAMNFANGFRRTRTFFVNLRAPHTAKLLIGGLLTGICGSPTSRFIPASCIPLGPNYEAVDMILSASAGLRRPGDVFAAVKLAGDPVFARLRRGERDVRADVAERRRNRAKHSGRRSWVPPAVDLFAAVGMASFIAAGYKTPLAAVVFVAETSGSHSY